MSFQRKEQVDDGNEGGGQMSRRDFLKMGIGALSGMVILEVGGASLLFMQPRGMDGEFGGVVNAGAVESFPPGSVVAYPAGRFFLVRSPEGGFLALYQRCTHLGCSVSWEPGQERFFCHCHASGFDIHGQVENPPAPRALDSFPVSIRDGQVWVDTGKARSRDGFAPEQLVFA